MKPNVVWIGCLCLVFAASSVFASDLETPLEGGDASSSLPAATYRDGSVSPSDLDDWQRYLGLVGRQATRQEAIEDLVIHRVLAASATSDTSEKSALTGRLDAELQLLGLESAEKALQQHLKVAAAPSEAAVKAAYVRDRSAYQRPRRWRLSNIFLRFPENADDPKRQQIRQRLNGVLERLNAGEDFAQIASEISESQTRLRGGDMGYSSLDRMRPEIARAVAELEVGDLSPIVETREGLHLLRCTAVQPEALRDFDEAKERVTRRLRRRNLEQLEEALETTLRKQLQPIHYRDLAATDGETAAEGKGGPVVWARYRLGEQERALDDDDLRMFLHRRGVRQSPETLSSDVLQGHLDDRLLLEARAHEAHRRQLIDEEREALLRRFRELELRAQQGANRLALEEIRPPDEETMRAVYDRQQDRMKTLRRRHVRAWVIRRDPSLGADFFEHLRQLGLRLASQGGDLSKVTEELAPHGELRDLGWMSDDQIWTLGLNVDHAVSELSVGDFSPLVQQGREFYLLELTGEEAEGQLSYDEARPRIQSALMAASRRQAGRRLRAAIVKEQAIEVMQ